MFHAMVWSCLTFVMLLASVGAQWSLGTFICSSTEIPKMPEGISNGNVGNVLDVVVSEYTVQQLLTAGK